jgi:hypothetical protein
MLEPGYRLEQDSFYTERGIVVVVKFSGKLYHFV